MGKRSRLLVETEGFSRETLWSLGILSFSSNLLSKVLGSGVPLEAEGAHPDPLEFCREGEMCHVEAKLIEFLISTEQAP